MGLLDPYEDKKGLVKDALENARVTYELTDSDGEIVIITSEDAEAKFIRIFDNGDDGFAAKDEKSREELIEDFDSKSDYERREPIDSGYLVSRLA